MPFFILLVGIVFIATGVKGTTSQLFTLLKGDFSGNNNFFYWFFAIIVIGSIGYVESLRKVSDAFLTLVVIVLFLSTTKNSGTSFFTQFVNQLQSAQNCPNSPTSVASTNIPGDTLSGTIEKNNDLGNTMFYPGGGL